jgi:hypothetical protein
MEAGRLIAASHKRTSTKPDSGSNRRSCSAWSHVKCAQPSRKKFFVLTTWLLPAAAMPCGHLPCCSGRELLPFVSRIKASPGGFGKLAGRLCEQGFKHFELEMDARQA